MNNMNVQYADEITSAIKYLREYIYNKEEFIYSFETELKYLLNTESVSITPDPAGGLNVEVSNIKNIEMNFPQSSSYIKYISNILLDSISKIETLVVFNDIAPSLINVIVVGSNLNRGLIIKI